MSAEVIQALIQITLAMSVAILIVGILRKPTRHLAGARVAYWLWLLIPACAVALAVPTPEASSAFIFSFIPQAVETTSNLGAAVAGSLIDYSFWILTLWLTISGVMLVLAAIRQRQFQTSIGTLVIDADGRLRGRDITGPMLVGVWRPRIVLPTDFKDRYSEMERAMILAHEEAHCARHDAIVNAIATTALCLFWPNPLMYWAVSRFRFDQELACDALVLSRFQKGRRHYADALIKAQLASEAHSRLPVACHWQSSHPLKERIAMLKRPLPGAMRRNFGVAAVIAVIGLSSYSVWATQPELSKETPTGDQSPGISFHSDEMSKIEDGVYQLTGNVTLSLSGSTRPNIKADRVEEGEDGSKLYEGNVTIEIGEASVNTDRATIASDGTIRMDAARISKLF